MNGSSAQLPQRLLSDASVPMNFCEAGLDCARAMESYLGDNVFVVEDVFEELKRLSGKCSALARLLEGWPAAAPFEIPQEVKLEVADILRINKRIGLHPNEDRGETATILFAKHRLDEHGERFDILIDDRGGKRFAEDRGLFHLDTPSLVIEMVCCGALSYDQGHRVWRGALASPQAQKAYVSRIQNECPSVLP